MAAQRAKRPGEAVFSVAMLIAGLLLAWQSYEISGFSALSSPGAFPMAAAAVMVIAALLTVIGDRRRANEVEGGAAARIQAFRELITPLAVVVFAGLLLGYAALLDRLGFLPTSLLFLVVAIHFLKRGSLGLSVLVAVGSLVVIYALFRLVFKVVLPEGVVPEREIMAWVTHLFDGAGTR